MLNRIAVKQLLANFMLWLCVAIVIGGFHLAQGNDPKSPFPTQELVKLINPALLGYVFSAGVLLFTLFAFVRHRSSNTQEQNRSEEFSSLAIDEIGSAFFNFGSLLLVAVFVGANDWYLAGALSSYVAGLYLKWPNG
ncbi:MAG: hypothetical protein AB2688_11590 [Candidatus Thiodiazotropha taylori]